MHNLVIRETVISAMLQECLLQLDVLSTPNLVELVNLCLDELRENLDRLEVRWLEFLAKVLSILPGRDAVQLDPDGLEDAADLPAGEMKGSVYRTKVVKSLCQSVPWNRKAHLTAFVSMFSDLTLTPEEFDLVQTKACKSLSKIRPQDLPPLIHQLSLLCRNTSSVVLLNTLGEYFKASIDDRLDEAGSEDMIGMINLEIARVTCV